MADFPIFGGYDKKEEVAFNAEDTINLFLIDSPQGKKKFAFLASPGLSEDVTVESGTDATRALFTFGDYLYGVFGASVYRFAMPAAGEDLLPEFLGSIDTVSGFVSISANNANEIMFDDGQNGYIYNANSAVFSRITSSDFPSTPLGVVCLDGYFVVPQGDSRQFQLSGLNAGTSWDALSDEAQIQAYPGFNIGVGLVNQRLYFFKTDSCEVWYDAGDSDFPFRRDNNLIFNYGCMTRSSIASQFGLLFWLSRDQSGVGSVMMTEGQEPVAISNDSIDTLIASFTAPEDMIAYIYKDGSHIFYVMSWNTDDKTLVYDVKTKLWSKWEMQQHQPVAGDINSTKTRHLSNCHAYFNGTHYIGSYKAPKLYKMSRQYTDNAGEPIRRVRVCQHFFDVDYKKMQINSLQVDMQMGLGESGDGTGIYDDQNDDPLINPQIYLSISRDGGISFGNERPAPIGKIGERLGSAKFRKLGQARDFVAKFIIYAPLRNIALLGASINYGVLAQ